MIKIENNRKFRFLMMPKKKHERKQFFWVIVHKHLTQSVGF